MKQDIFNIHELIEIKWSIRILIDVSANKSNAVANDELYQKLSFACEQEKTRLKCTFSPKKWIEVKNVIMISESRAKEMYDAALKAWNAVNDIKNIQELSFDEWLQNGKSFK